VSDKPFRAKAVFPGTLMLGPVLLFFSLTSLIGGNPLLGLFLLVVGAAMTWYGANTRQQRIRDAREWNAAFDRGDFDE